MYLKKIKIENFGPVENFDYECQFYENGNPQPILLVGTNGAGKTSVIANIIDAFIELKRKKYESMQEVVGSNYLKLGKKDLISKGKNYSFIRLEFLADKSHGIYVDFGRNITHQEFTNKYQKEDFPNINWNNTQFINNGFYKAVELSNKFQEAFDEEIMLFFPFNRYENPAWLNKKEELSFKIKQDFIGKSNRSFIKGNVIEQVREWILNVVLDAELYERTTSNLVTFFELYKTPVPLWAKNYNILQSSFGRNTSFKRAISNVLSVIYKTKDKNLDFARIGVSKKNYRRISIVGQRKGEKGTIELAPTISHLSSGEIMLFALFCSILMDYDYVLKNNFVTLTNIKGIVVIDEIDIHLHLDFQKNVLPKLIKTFPKIQFIITTHSPLFLMGMEEEFQDLKLVNLPYGNLIPLSEFCTVQDAYELFIDKFSSFQKTYEITQRQLEKLTKSLIITEGKTDWKHMQKALERFQKKNEFLNLNFDFLRYENNIEMGDSELESMCIQFSKTPQPKKIICIFDRDSPKIIKNHPDPFKNWGNNVFSFCIPKPLHRNNYKNISIEFLYTDADLRTLDENNKRLLFSNEIEKTVIQKMSKKGSTVKYVLLDEPDQETEFDKKIYDQDLKKIKNKLGQEIGISKSVFAKNVYEDKTGFNQFNIETFKPIFQTINKIINSIN